MDLYMDFPPFLYDAIGEDAACENFDLMYGDGMGINRRLDDDEFGKSVKIVELTDVGCDAFPPESPEKRKVGRVKKNRDKIFSKENIRARRTVKPEVNVSCNLKKSDREDDARRDLLEKYSLCHERLEIKNIENLQNVSNTPTSREVLEKSSQNNFSTARSFRSKVEEKNVKTVNDTKKHESCTNDNDELAKKEQNKTKRDKFIQSEEEKQSDNNLAVNQSPEKDKIHNFAANKNLTFRFGKDGKLRASKLPVWQGFKLNRSKTNIEMNRGPMELVENNHLAVNDIELNFQRFNKQAVEMEKMNGDEKLQNIESTQESEGIYSNKEMLTEEEKIVETMDSSSKKVEKKWKNKEDQSQSDMWSEEYEKAFAKGRSIGTKIFQMAKASRNERKRLFREYGFENYNQNPRKMPQEILDIGLCLVEKFLKKDGINNQVNNSEIINESDIFLSRFLLSQLIRQ